MNTTVIRYQVQELDVARQAWLTTGEYASLDSAQLFRDLRVRNNRRRPEHVRIAEATTITTVIG